MVTMRKAAEDMAAHLAAEQARPREAHEHLAEATAAHAVEAQRGSGQRAELERMRQDAEARRIDRAEAQRDAGTAQAGAEPERVRADSTWRREELRQVLDGRASVLEEARAELPARARRPGRELDHLRAERGGAGSA
jgi:hypothetical protein